MKYKASETYATDLILQKAGARAHACKMSVNTLQKDSISEVEPHQCPANSFDLKTLGGESFKEEKTMTFKIKEAIKEMPLKTL